MRVDRPVELVAADPDMTHSILCAGVRTKGDNLSPREVFAESAKGQHHSQTSRFRNFLPPNTTDRGTVDLQWRDQSD